MVPVRDDAWNVGWRPGYRRATHVVEHRLDQRGVERQADVFDLKDEQRVQPFLRALLGNTDALQLGVGDLRAAEVATLAQGAAARRRTSETSRLRFWVLRRKPLAPQRVTAAANALSSRSE